MFRRFRIGDVATSAKKYTAPPIAAIASGRISVMSSTSESHDFFQDERTDTDQLLGLHAAHRCERVDLAAELLPGPHRVGNHVEERRERTADLALNRHG